MTLLKGNNIKLFAQRLFSLLPPSLLSSLSQPYLDLLSNYESSVRDVMFRCEGERLGFYLLCALDNDRFKPLVLEHIKLDSELSLKRFGGTTWKAFLRILIVHASAPPECEPVFIELVDKWCGGNNRVTCWLMYETGWIIKTGWKNHFKISAKGVKLVEAVIKQTEREYSQFFVSQMALKKEKMGNLWENK